MQMKLFNDAEGQVEGVKGEKLNKAYTSIVGFVFEKTFLKWSSEKSMMRMQ